MDRGIINISRSKMRKLLLNPFLLFVFVLLFHSCSGDRKDSFYSSSCGYDCKKIPLIRPLYLGGTTGVEGEWNLSGFIEKKGSIPVTSINVLDSIIISYYFDKYIVIPENRDTTWYIHVPSKKIEYKFSSEVEFYEQVRKFTDKQIEFIEVPILYKELVKKGYLDWFPEAYKK